MKVKISLLFLLLFQCHKNDISNKAIAVTIASSLRCRENPSIESTIIKKFKFGTPIIVELNEKKEHININSWIKASDENCYVSAEFLLFNKDRNDIINVLKPEVYKCVPTEDVKEYPIYYIGNLYIHLSEEEAEFSEGFQNYNLIIETGTTAINKDSISFTSIKIGILDQARNWIKNSDKFNNRIIIKSQDENLVYYRKKNSEYTRKEAIKRCKQLENKPASLNNIKNVPWETFYIPQAISYGELRDELEIYYRPINYEK